MEGGSVASVRDRPAFPAREAMGGLRRGTLALLLGSGGVIGLVASLALTLDKLALLEHPRQPLSCDLNPLVSCAPGLADAFGSILGLPNSLLGLVAFPVPVVVATVIAAGASLASWFWRAFEIAMVAALAVVVVLIQRSIGVLGVVCPWCVLIWAAVIPMSIGLTLHGVAAGHWWSPDAIRRACDRLLGWLPLITFGCYVLILVVAQLRLDLLRLL